MPAKDNGSTVKRFYNGCANIQNNEIVGNGSLSNNGNAGLSGNSTATLLNNTVQGDNSLS